MEKVAKAFWKNQTKYPEYGNIKQRRLFEIKYLVPQLYETKSLLDLGCGDGALIKCLQQLTDIEKYYAYDIADNLMKGIDAEKKIYDCTNPDELPETDVTIFAGVIPFLFTDEQVDNVLSKIKSKTLFLRTPCTLQDDDELVDTFSVKLQSDYASLYRTVPKVKQLIEKHFDVDEIIRIYPDDIESAFGTKQYYFKCHKK